MKIKKRLKGTSLFELIIATLVVSIVLIALVSLATKSVSLTTFSRDKTRANRYAQELVEWLRGERDAGWNAFVGRAGTARWCMTSLAWTQGSTCGSGNVISGTPFTRDLNLTITGGNTVTAVVSIKWQDQSGVHETRTTNVYTDWKGN